MIDSWAWNAIGGKEMWARPRLQRYKKQTCFKMHLATTVGGSYRVIQSHTVSHSWSHLWSTQAPGPRSQSQISTRIYANVDGAFIRPLLHTQIIKFLTFFAAYQLLCPPLLVLWQHNECHIREDLIAVSNGPGFSSVQFIPFHALHKEMKQKRNSLGQYWNYNHIWLQKETISMATRVKPHTFMYAYRAAVVFHPCTCPPWGASEQTISAWGRGVRRSGGRERRDE